MIGEACSGPTWPRSGEVAMRSSDDTIEVQLWIARAANMASARVSPAGSLRL